MASFLSFSPKAGVRMSAENLRDRLNARGDGWALEMRSDPPTLARTDSHDTLYLMLEGDIVRRISWSPDNTILPRRRYPTIDELGRNGFEYQDENE